MNMPFSHFPVMDDSTRDVLVRKPPGRRSLRGSLGLPLRLFLGGSVGCGFDCARGHHTVDSFLSCQAREGGRWQWIPAGAAPWGGRLGGRHPACCRASTCWALPTPPAPDVRDGAPAPCIPQIATGLSTVSDCGVAKSDTFSLKQSISKTVLKDARGDQS